jgi:hypothetical protein
VDGGVNKDERKLEIRKKKGVGGRRRKNVGEGGKERREEKRII